MRPTLHPNSPNRLVPFPSTPRPLAKPRVPAASTSAPSMENPALAPRRITRLSSTTLALGLYWILALRLHEVVPGLAKFRLALVALALGSVILMLRVTPAGWRFLWSRRQFRLIVAYAVAALASVPFGLWPAHSANLALTAMPPSILLTAAILMCPPDVGTLRRLHLGFVAGAVALALALFTVGREEDGRLTVTYMLDPNDIAVIFACSVPLVLGLLGRSRTLLAFTLMLCVPLLAFATLSTGSRGGILALGAGMIVFVLGLRRRSRSTGVALLVLGAGVAWTVAPATTRERVGTLTNLEDDYNTRSDAGRKRVWLRGMRAFAQRPLVGAGIGNYPLADGAVRSEVVVGGRWQTAHNSLVQVAVETGAFGLAVLGTMLVGAARRSRRTWSARGRGAPWNHRPEFLASFAAFMTGAFFLSLAYSWALIGLLALLAHADSTLSPRTETSGRASPLPS